MTPRALLTLTVLPDLYAISRLAANADVPAGAPGNSFQFRERRMNCRLSVSKRAFPRELPARPTGKF
jgi:hypothetical protein